MSIVRATVKVNIQDALKAKVGGLVSRGIKSVEVTADGHLIFTLTDGSTVDLGNVIPDTVPGGYYTPVIEQVDAEHMRVTYVPSQEDMEPIAPLTIELPQGPKGDALTYEDLTDEQRAALKGKDGYTPIKGVDYFDGEAGDDYVLTDADKAEIAEQAAELVEVPTNPEDIGAQPAGNYLTEETDPTVPSWAKQAKKPSYTAAEVGALPSTTKIPSTPAEVGADPAGTAGNAVSAHNTNTAAHNDIRLQMQALTDRLNAFFDSNDTTLDELSEIVAYITENKELIDAITTSKVNVSDIIDNLTTNVANKPLSAAQGVVLKSLIDALNTAKLDTSKLQEAIDIALAQAKESGDFDGPQGIRGRSILRITTAPTAYTTATGGFTPAYRIALSTVKTQSGATEVMVGDTVLRNYYTYPVGYVDASYVYLGKYASIRGSAGAAGTSVTITETVESTESGGENTVTFSDGNTLSVKNGKDGGTGVPGYSIFTFLDSAIPPDFDVGATGNNVAISDVWTNGRAIQVNDLLIVENVLYRFEYRVDSLTYWVCKVNQIASDGEDGEDGVSPTVTVSKSGTVTTITITDASGTKTATINDGEAGDDYVLTDADKAEIAALVKPLLKTETWTFELEDGTTVTKDVLLL